MSNLGDVLKAAALKTGEIDDELDALIAKVDANQATIATSLQGILDAIAAIPGAPDVAAIKAEVDQLVATLVPTETN